MVGVRSARRPWCRSCSARRWRSEPSAARAQHTSVCDSVDVRGGLGVSSSARTTFLVTACRNHDCDTATLESPPGDDPTLGGGHRFISFSELVSDQGFLTLHLSLSALKGTFQDGDVWHIVVVDQCLGQAVVDTSQSIDEYDRPGSSWCGQDCARGSLELTAVPTDVDYDAGLPCDGGLGAFDAGGSGVGGTGGGAGG
jgi:hypothetical protein